MSLPPDRDSINDLSPAWINPDGTAWTDPDVRTVAERIAHSVCGARVTELSRAIDDVERDALREFLENNMTTAYALRALRNVWRHRLATLEAELRDHVRIMDAANDRTTP